MFKLKIRTNSDVFGNTEADAVPEVVRLLRDVAARLEKGVYTGKLIDSNGRQVGGFGLHAANRD